MRVTFLGVGEACDETMPNTSVWVETEADNRRSSVLLDCGFTVPPNYWQRTSDPEDLDALWISHFHGDHFFGVPALAPEILGAETDQAPCRLLGKPASKRP